MEYLKDINIIYAANGNRKTRKIEFKSHISDLITNNKNNESGGHDERLVHPHSDFRKAFEMGSLCSTKN